MSRPIDRADEYTQRRLLEEDECRCRDEPSNRDESPLATCCDCGAHVPPEDMWCRDCDDLHHECRPDECEHPDDDLVEEATERP